MCLFGAGGVEENRLVFLINIFVKNNLVEYPVVLKLQSSPVTVINNNSGREIEVPVTHLDDKTLVDFLKGDITARGLKQKAEEKVNS